MMDTRKLTVETLLVSDIVDKQYSHGASVICRGNRPESLLAGSVPYLQLNSLAVQIDCPDLEVDTYRCNK